MKKIHKSTALACCIVCIDTHQNRFWRFSTSDFGKWYCHCHCHCFCGVCVCVFYEVHNNTAVPNHGDECQQTYKSISHGIQTGSKRAERYSYVSHECVAAPIHRSFNKNVQHLSSFSYHFWLLTCLPYSIQSLAHRCLFFRSLALWWCSYVRSLVRSFVRSLAGSLACSLTRSLASFGFVSMLPLSVSQSDLILYALNGTRSTYRCDILLSCGCGKLHFIHPRCDVMCVFGVWVSLFASRMFVQYG